MSDDLLPHIIDLKEGVGRLIGTQEAMNKKLDAHAARMNSHSSRIRKVENRQHWYAGAASVLGAVGAWVIQKFSGG